MRTLLPLVLLGAVAANDENPIIHWLKEHGKDAFETVMECKDLPHEFQKMMDSSCSKKPSPADQVAMAVWWSIRELEQFNSTLPEIVKNHYDVMEKIKSLATMRLVASTHKNVADYCANPTCGDLAKDMSFKVSPCYASLTCSFLTQFVPFSPCKDAFETYMNDFFGTLMGKMCESDEVGNATLYCSEMDSDLMYKDMDCFIEYKMGKIGGVQKCTPKCVKQWQGMKKMLPKCTQELESKQNAMYASLETLAKDLAKDATDPNFKRALQHMPKQHMTYDENCNRDQPEAEALWMQVV